MLLLRNPSLFRFTTLLWLSWCIGVRPDTLSPIPSPAPAPVNVTVPACDLCGNIAGGGTPNEYQSVPEALLDHLADTTIAGPMKCGELQQVLAAGIFFTANLCPIIQRSAGVQCCNP